MAVSDVSVCSNALQRLGADPISALNQAVKRAQVAANLFPVERDALLRAHPWNFATRSELLAPDATAPAFDFAARFAVPAEWLRTLQVGTRSQRLVWRQEGRYILCDESVLPLRYVYANTDLGSWDAKVVHALELRMAAAMAYAITQSASLRDQMLAEAEAAFKQAKTLDGQDEDGEEPFDHRQTGARYGRGRI
jgi:hypothetical protein